MSRSRVIHSARLISGGVITENAWVRSAGGTVTGVGVGETWAPADEIINAAEVAGAGAVLTPGFIDLHSHGGGGASHEEGADAIRTARALHTAHGTTRAVISLVAAPREDTARRVAEIAALSRTDPGILGSHLEGPFLDPAHHGAHDPALLRAPDPAGLAHLLATGDRTIRQITLAPELPGAAALIAQALAAGAAVAVGHTSADADTARAAFDAGATILTHAFNAMPGIHHRAPGPVLAAARDRRVTLEAIADGVHLHDDIVRLLWEVAPGRVALVTDAMAAAGAADGDYDLGAVAVRVTGGIARTRDTSAIAGSTLTQDAALRRAVGAGIPLPDAVTALTTTPARALGEHARLGQLAVGFADDAVLLDSALAVRRVFAAAEPSKGS